MPTSSNPVRDSIVWQKERAGKMYDSRLSSRPSIFRDAGSAHWTFAMYLNQYWTPFSLTLRKIISRTLFKLFDIGICTEWKLCNKNYLDLAHRTSNQQGDQWQVNRHAGSASAALHTEMLIQVINAHSPYVCTMYPSWCDVRRKVFPNLLITPALCWFCIGRRSSSRSTSGSSLWLHHRSYGNTALRSTSVLKWKARPMHTNNCAVVGLIGMLSSNWLETTRQFIVLVILINYSIDFGSETSNITFVKHRHSKILELQLIVPAGLSGFVG